MALTACLVVMPLMMAAVVAAAAVFFMFRKSSAAQSLCVQQAVRTQEALADTLQRLLAMNPQARTLRKQRDLADRALNAALSAGEPRAIAIAKAVQLAVIYMQVQHRARQNLLLAQAYRQRLENARRLRSSLAPLGAKRVTDLRVTRSLAVYASPESSLTPDYIRAEPFAELQQERFRFQIDLRPGFLIPTRKGSWSDTPLPQWHECSASLIARGKKSEVRILAASPRSKR